MLSNIKEYEDKYVETHSFTKDHSPNRVKFFIEKNDDWFIRVVTYRNTSGVVNDEEVCIKKDLDIFINQQIRCGYKILTIK